MEETDGVEATIVDLQEVVVVEDSTEDREIMDTEQGLAVDEATLLISRF